MPNIINNFISRFKALQANDEPTSQQTSADLQQAQEATTHYLLNRDNAVDLARNLKTATGGLSTARDFFHSLEELFQIPAPQDGNLKNILTDVKSRARDFVTGFIQYLKSDENILRQALGYNDNKPRAIFNTGS